MIRGPSRRTLLAGAVAGAGLAACGQNAAPLDDQGRVRLRLVLDRPAGAAHGGFYQGVVSGLYAARNLNVEILSGGPTVSPPELLASGAVELAIGADGFDAFALMASGAPVRAVAAYFQRDTHALVSRAANPVETPEDLGDRPVIVTPADAAGVWPVMAAAAALGDAATIDAADGQEVAAFRADGEAVLLTDLRDALPNLPGGPASVTLLADMGYPAYGGLLLAPNGFARDNAEALRAFIIGSAEGWRDYLARDPAAAYAAIRAANPEAQPAALAAVRDRLSSAQIVQGGEAAIRGIGVMSEDRWRAFAEAASQAQVMPPGVNWRDAFTLDYLPGRG